MERRACFSDSQAYGALGFKLLGIFNLSVQGFLGSEGFMV